MTTLITFVSSSVSAGCSWSWNDKCFCELCAGSIDKFQPQRQREILFQMQNYKVLINISVDIQYSLVISNSNPYRILQLRGQRMLICANLSFPLVRSRVGLGELLNQNFYNFSNSFALFAHLVSLHICRKLNVSELQNLWLSTHSQSCWIYILFLISYFCISSGSLIPPGISLTIFHSLFCKDDKYILWFKLTLCLLPIQPDISGYYLQFQSYHFSQRLISGSCHPITPIRKIMKKLVRRQIYI